MVAEKARHPDANPEFTEDQLKDIVKTEKNWKLLLDKAMLRSHTELMETIVKDE